MTPTTRPIIRLSSDVARGRGGRRTVVRLGPGDLIAFKEFGRRTWYETTIGACKSTAIKQVVAARLAEKAAKRKAEGKPPLRTRRFA